MSTQILPKLDNLVANLPLEDAVTIELQEGIPIFRAARKIQNRIEFLLSKQKQTQLSLEEEQELDSYEEIDDYLSFINRLIRNLQQNQGI